MSKYYLIELDESEGTMTDTSSGEEIIIVIEPTDGSGPITVVFDSEWGTDLEVGDLLEAYTPLSQGIVIVDWIKQSDWYRHHYLDEETEIKKYFSFGIKLSKLRLSWSSLGALMTTFIYAIKPTFTSAIFMREDDTPLFIIGDYSYIDYVQIDLIVGGDAYLPADFAYQKSFGGFYYKNAERALSTNLLS
jgi:hypothetical protein